jgi:hypothetical protein
MMRLSVWIIQGELIRLLPLAALPNGLKSDMLCYDKNSLSRVSSYQPKQHITAMEKKIINIVAENTAKEVIRILKEYRAAGKTLDDVISAFEKQDAGTEVTTG